MIKRADMATFDIYVTIVNHRNTPNESLYNPVYCMMNRPTKTLLTTTSHLFKPEVSVEQHPSLTAAQLHQTHYCNQYSNHLVHLQNGHIVCIKPFYKNNNIWKQTVVTKKLVFCFYRVETSDGSYVRTRVRFRKSNEEPARWRFMLCALDLGLVLYECLPHIPPSGTPIIDRNTFDSCP